MRGAVPPFPCTISWHGVYLTLSSVMISTYMARFSTKISHVHYTFHLHIACGPYRYFRLFVQRLFITRQLRQKQAFVSSKQWLCLQWLATCFELEGHHQAKVVRNITGTQSLSWKRSLSYKTSSWLVNCITNQLKGKGHPCTGTEALYRPYGLYGE